jgi:hypothetical protein
MAKRQKDRQYNGQKKKDKKTNNDLQNIKHKSRLIGLVYGIRRHFLQYVSYIMAVSFIGGGNRSTRRKPPTCRKSLTNFIT